MRTSAVLCRAAAVGAAATALVLGAMTGASADTIAVGSADAGYDPATRTFTIAVGQTATADIAYGVDATGKSGCDRTGRGSHVAFTAGSSTAGVVADLTPDVRYDACPADGETLTRPVSFTGAAPGVTEVSFEVASWASNGAGVGASTFLTEPATFTVVVTGEGRHAPAIANEFLNHDADESVLAACRAALGTNDNRSNWHGNLISAVAEHFGDRVFTEDEEHVVVDHVLDLCGVETAG